MLCVQREIHLRLILECSKINSQPQNKSLFPTLWNEHRASSNSKTLILGYIGPKGDHFIRFSNLLKGPPTVE